MSTFFDRKEKWTERNSRPVSPQSHICKDFTSVAQTPDFTDIFYVSKIGQTVSSMSKIQHQWIAPKRSVLGGNKNCTIITYDSSRRVCLSRASSRRRQPENHRRWFRSSVGVAFFSLVRFFSLPSQYKEKK